jgi:microcystin-dependent protein
MTINNFIIIIIVLLLVYLLYKNNKLEKKIIHREGFTDSQAIQNVANLYNENSMKVTDLEVTGNLTVTNSFNMLPSGVIIIWTKKQIPNGWVICNGQNETPDLRNRFILGDETDGENLNKTGGSFTTTIKKKNLPDHTHKIKNIYGRGAGGSNSNIGSSGNYFVTVDNGSGPNDNMKGEASTIDDTDELSKPMDTYPPYYKLIYIIKI